MFARYELLAWGYKTFFILILIEQEMQPAQKC